MISCTIACSVVSQVRFNRTYEYWDGAGVPFSILETDSGFLTISAVLSQQGTNYLLFHALDSLGGVILEQHIADTNYNYKIGFPNNLPALLKAGFLN